MSLDGNSIVDLVRRIAKKAVDETAPFAFAVGKVLAPEPKLQIYVDQKLTLSDKQLILTNAVRDYYVKLTTVGEKLGEPDGKEHVTQKTQRSPGAAEDYGAFDSHDHDYKGDKWWKVNLRLQTGESVLLLRIDGGQKYIVLDRVFPPNNKGLIQ